MAIDVREKFEIRCTQQEIAQFAFEPSNDPTWIGGIAEAQLLTQRPIGNGTQVRRVAKFLGRTIEYVLEVVEFEPQRLMVMNSIKSPFPMRVSYSFEKASLATTVARIRVEGNSKSFYGIADFLMKPLVARNLRRDLTTLKQIMEEKHGDNKTSH